MPSTGYSASGYQITWASLSADPTINDGNTATGFTSSHSPPNQVTAGLDIGSSGLITDISVTFGYGTTLTYILEWSTNSTTWFTTGISLPGQSVHGGSISDVTVTLSGLSIMARYLRLSISDASGGARIMEMSCTGSSNIVSFTAAFQGRTTIGVLLSTVSLSAAFKGRTTIGSTIGSYVFGNLWASFTGKSLLNASPGFTASLTASLTGRTQITSTLGPPFVARFQGHSTITASLTTALSTSSVDYQVVGPTFMSIGSAYTFTVTRLQVGGAATITVAPAPIGASPITPFVLPAFGSGSVTFTFTPLTLGVTTFHFTNSGGLTDPPDMSIGVGPGATSVPAPCGPEFTNHSDYITVATNLPLTFAPGDVKPVTFNVADMPGGRWIDHFNYAATLSPANDGVHTLTPYQLDVWAFPEITDTDSASSGRFRIGSVPTPYGSGPNQTATFPIAPICDNPGGTATFYVKNNEAVSITLSDFTILYTTYDCRVRSWSAASFNDTNILFAWLSTNGDNNCIKTATHRWVRGAKGMPSTGWETETLVEGAICSNVGVSFLQSGEAFLLYDHDKRPYTHVSPAMGGVGTWGDRQPPLHNYYKSDMLNSTYNPALGPLSVQSSGRTDHMAYVFDNGLRLTGHLNGDVWYPVFRARFGPGHWIGNGFTCLEQNNVSGHGPGLYSAQTTDGLGRVWALTFQSALPTTYIPSGMIRLRNGTLVSMLYNPANKRSYGAWSHDKGITWSIAGHYTESVPELEIGPALTVLGDVAVVCWVDADDQPQFAVSEDGGTNFDLG